MGVDLQDTSWLLSVSAFALAMSATPGPNNAMVASSGATFGFLRTMPHLLGVSIGFPVMLIAVALGAGTILNAYPIIDQVMRWVGTAYLLWLAWHIATARPPAASPDEKGRSRPLRFVEAALFQWVNPKAWLITLSAVATYATTNGSVVPHQVLVLAAVFFIICVPTTSLWTAIGAGAGRLLHAGRGLRVFNIAMAALLVASLVPLFIEQ